MVLAEPIKITRLITRSFDIMGIRYFVGGSLASSLHGIPRSTQDVDLVADIKEEHINPIVQALQGEFYIDVEMIKDAIKWKGSFNIIHLPTMFKVDIFILKSDASSLDEINRRQEYHLPGDPDEQIYVATAEDVILHKLYWYQIGGCVAERQWSDIIGVLQVQSERLEHEYLMKGAQLRGVSELLAKALDEAKQIT